MQAPVILAAPVVAKIVLLIMELLARSFFCTDYRRPLT